MDHQFVWAIPDRVLVLQWNEVVTLDTYRKMNATLVEILEEASQKIYIIADTSLTREFPLNALEVTKIFNFAPHENLERAVAIVANATVRLMIHLVSHNLRAGRYNSCANWSDAVYKLGEYDSTLDLDTLLNFKPPKFPPESNPIRAWYSLVR